MKNWTIAALLITTAAFAQKTQNQYEPPNAPGAGQKLLSQFAGDWDVVKTFFPRNGKPIVTKGTCKQYMVQGGKFLQSDFTFSNLCFLGWAQRSLRCCQKRRGWSPSRITKIGCSSSPVS